MINSSSKRSKIFYGWWVVGALTVVGMVGPMARYTVTAFGPFIGQELGWGATQIGLALSLSLWVYAFASIPVGWLLDRIGSRRVIFLGGVLLFSGLWGLSGVNKLWEFYLTVGLAVGIGVSMTHFLTTQSTSRKWFIRKAGLTGGILTAAFWLGSGLLSPLLTGLASGKGWRTACFLYAAGTGVMIVLMAVLVVRDTPESLGLYPDGTTPPEQPNRVFQSGKEIQWSVREATGTWSFWMAFLGYSLVGIPGQGWMGHLILWAVKLGAAKATAGIFLTVFTAGVGLTAIFGGWLADRIGKRRVLATAYGLCAMVLIVAWLTIHTTKELMVIFGIFGLMYGISSGAGLWAAYLGDLFGRSSVGKLYGILTLGYGLIGGSGPLIWGKIYDFTGAYNAAALFSAFCFLLIVICILWIKPVKKPVTIREPASIPV